MIQIDDKERCCGNCRFFYEDGRQCRRFPPQVLNDSDSDYTGACYSVFPSMNREEWCGEHQPQEGWIVPIGFVPFGGKNEES